MECLVCLVIGCLGNLVEFVFCLGLGLLHFVACWGFLGFLCALYYIMAFLFCYVLFFNYEIIFDLVYLLFYDLFGAFCKFVVIWLNRLLYII